MLFTIIIADLVNFSYHQRQSSGKEGKNFEEIDGQESK